VHANAERGLRSGLTITVLLILAVLWAAVLVPPALRSRSQGRRGEPIGPLDLRGRMRAFGGSRERSGIGGGLPGAFRPAAFPRRPGPPAGPTSLRATGDMTPAQKRRRDVLVILLGAVGLSFVLAAFTGTVMLWLVHVLADVLLAGYLCLLVQMKQRGGVPRGALPPPIPLERPRQARHVAHPTRELALRRTAAP